MNRFPALWACVTLKHLKISPERRHGPTRVPGHAFLVWRSSWRIVMFIQNITSARNSISSQLGSSCQGNRYGTEKAVGTKSHLLGHSPPASQAGQPSSLRSHWFWLCKTNEEVWPFELGHESIGSYDPSWWTGVSAIFHSIKQLGVADLTPGSSTFG